MTYLPKEVETIPLFDQLINQSIYLFMYISPKEKKTLGKKLLSLHGLSGSSFGQDTFGAGTA